jgi:hypothetical protein
VPSGFTPEWREAIHAFEVSGQIWEIYEMFTFNPAVFYSATTWAGLLGTGNAYEGQQRGWDAYIMIETRTCQPGWFGFRWVWQATERWSQCNSGAFKYEDGDDGVYQGVKGIQAGLAKCYARFQKVYGHHVRYE